jgi:hypothetical protein
MTRHTRHRRDTNHVEIERALRHVTAVRDIHNYGGGMGDLLARHVVTKAAVFLEIKAKQNDKLTESERAFAWDFRASWACVHSVDEALAAIGVEVGR